MAIQYVLGCPVLWSEWDFGIEAAGGTMTFYKSTDHATKKNVYKDANGATPWDNPLTLDPYGRSTSPIYFKNDPDSDNYFIVTKNSLGVEIYTIDDYQGAITAQEENTSVQSEDINYIRNPQFLIWDHEPVLYPGGTDIITTDMSITNPEQVCDEWYFRKNVTGTTIDKISQKAFIAGQTIVEATPKFYLQYSCATNGGGETRKDLMQVFYNNSPFLAGTRVLFSIAASADSSNRSLTISWGQNFGSGGSTFVEQVVVPTFPLTTSFNRYNFFIDIPSISGKVIGVNDYSYIIISMDKNVTCTYNFCNLLLQNQSINPVISFPTDTYEGYKSQAFVEFSHPTGDIKQAFFGNESNVYQYGWLPLDDNTIGKPGSGATYSALTYFNLFCYLYTSCANAQCPVSGGRTTGAVVDWNLGKTLRLPLSLGRLLGTSGAGAGLTNRVPGVTGGTETSTALTAHTHTFDATRGHLPSLQSKSWTGTDEIATGASTEYSPVTVGAGGLVNITETDSTGSGTPFSLMNPFLFIPTYIHI